MEKDPHGSFSFTYLPFNVIFTVRLRLAFSKGYHLFIAGDYCTSTWLR